ncbi:protein DEHYDRATION-INDUCED 19 homolog 4-like isoform X2 [Camellia sinensis]|uniref:protein DEHYDRATION-INDUCED 19 homolog 4-like isoform X2 n=1 Tax=Camellia sinensis TaxID=4442 RepID=UPI001035673E|nr:protein DEHYDRATION-INDUCED 19 homolog 4-like isoform X2 [Camellia sinensis]
MDSDSSITRLAAAVSRRYHSRSDLYNEREAIDGDEESRSEFLCPFCAEDFDMVGLCCHIDEDHAVAAKNGRRRRFRKCGSNSTFSILRKELREGNLQSFIGGSQFLVSSSNTEPDPLLSSFMYNLPMVDELASVKPRSSVEASSVKESSSKDSSQRKSIQQSPLSVKDQEEKARKCEFVRGLLLSTFLDDNL